MREKMFSITKKDLVIENFSGSGAGGQYRNRHMNCVRIRHPDSGAVAIGTEQRSREQNLKVAFKRLAESKVFRDWVKMESCRISGKMDDIKRYVDREIKCGENIRIEVKKDGKWVLE